MPGVKGASGRPAKSTEQHRQDGTYQKCRHENRVDAKIPPATLPCPGDLNEHGAELWKRICATLPREVVTKLDADSLRAYCETWELYRKVYPKMIADPFDKDTRILWANCIDKLDKLGRQFGWSPQSRASLQMPPKDESDTDPMVEFMRRRNERS